MGHRFLRFIHVTSERIAGCENAISSWVVRLLDVARSEGLPARQSSTLLMNGDGKRGDSHRPKLPRPFSTLPNGDARPEPHLIRHIPNSESEPFVRNGSAISREPSPLPG
jgi:hypothetical protein